MYVVSQGKYLFPTETSMKLNAENRFCVNEWFDPNIIGSAPAADHQVSAYPPLYPMVAVVTSSQEEITRDHPLNKSNQWHFAMTKTTNVYMNLLAW